MLRMKLSVSAVGALLVIGACGGSGGDKFSGPGSGGNGDGSSSTGGGGGADDGSSSSEGVGGSSDRASSSSGGAGSGNESTSGGGTGGSGGTSEDSSNSGGSGGTNGDSSSAGGTEGGSSGTGGSGGANNESSNSGGAGGTGGEVSSSGGSGGTNNESSNSGGTGGSGGSGGACSQSTEQQTPPSCECFGVSSCSPGQSGASLTCFWIEQPQSSTGGPTCHGCRGIELRDLCAFDDDECQAAVDAIEQAMQCDETRTCEVIAELIDAIPDAGSLRCCDLPGGPYVTQYGTCS